MSRIYECGQWVPGTGRMTGHGCQRPAEFINPNQITLHGLYCKMHKAGNDRRRWNKKILIPLSEEHFGVLTAELEESNALQRTRAKEQNEAFHHQMRASMKNYWLEEAQTTETVEFEGEDWNRDIRRWEITRQPQPEYRPHISEDHRVAVEESDSKYDDVILPVEIRWSGTGRFTANSARGLARALLEAANLADIHNAKLREKI